VKTPKYHAPTRPPIDLVADGWPRNLRESSQKLAEHLNIDFFDDL